MEYAIRQPQGNIFRCEKCGGEQKTTTISGLCFNCGEDNSLTFIGTDKEFYEYWGAERKNKYV